MLICKTKQRGFRVKQYKHGLYKFNNFFGSPSRSHNNNFNKAKSEHGLLPGPELEMSKNWNSSSGRFLASPASDRLVPRFKAKDSPGFILV